MGVFIALWLKLLFANHRYNIYEILVLFAYVLGEVILLLTIFILMASAFSSSIIAVIGLFLYFSYIIWAIGQFFGKKKFLNYLKSLFAYILGSVSYVAALIALAYLLTFI